MDYMKKMKDASAALKERGLVIRKARIGDIRKIHKILSAYTNEGTVLPRSLSELYDQLRDFFVSINPEDGSIAGTCSMHICWDRIAEIRSLAVVEESQHARIGTELVNACIQEARQLEVDQIFVLTYATKFFRRFGFRKVDKAVLPHKVWSDCMKCVKFPDCDEEAMMLDITGNNSA
jgi:amino-acid N-acetyltransferase